MKTIRFKPTPDVPPHMMILGYDDVPIFRVFQCDKYWELCTRGLINRAYRSNYSHGYIAGRMAYQCYVVGDLRVVTNDG